MNRIDKIRKSIKAGEETDYVIDCEFLLTELDSTKKKLQDIIDAYKTTMDEKCTLNEMHCTCVPFLRKHIKELESRNAKIDDELQDTKFYLDQLSAHNCYQKLKVLLGEVEAALKIIHSTLDVASGDTDVDYFESEEEEKEEEPVQWATRKIDEVIKMIVEKV